MKYLPVPDFEIVTTALNFDTPDCSVTGGCDLYTTKSTGSDKKLYKTIDRDLSSLHDGLVKLGNSLSPPDRKAMLASSLDVKLFSRSSPFGPLSELSSRRTFGYLIATLNASHPHYDFSHVLRPTDFKRERGLRRVMANLDSILQNVRPTSGVAANRGTPTNPAFALATPGVVWGPQCWALIDKEMRLSECTLFSYNPDVDPFAEDESAIWAAHYFVFSRPLKRVAYLYVRIVPVLSSQSPPTVRPAVLYDAKRHRAGNLIDAAEGAKKRARYWLGDRSAKLIEAGGDDDDDPTDDGLSWNRAEDGGLVPVDDDEETYDDGDGFDEDEDEDDDDQVLLRTCRDASEDVIADMET